jgi:phage tail sheath protein FI
MGDANSQAQLLNNAKINTLVRKNGWRLWGGLSCATDANYKFINVIRTEDVIAESIQAAFLWAVDKGLTATFVADVVDSVQAFLDTLTARGAILGGQAWANKDLNTVTSLQAGNLFVDYTFNPVPPAHSITFRSQITNTYLATVLGS